MINEFKTTPIAIQIGVIAYLAAVLAGGGYLSLGEVVYAVPILITGAVGAFFAVFQRGRMTIISALLGLILNLVLLFGLAAEDIFMAVQNGEVPNLHYGLPLVVGLFGYLLGQVNQLLHDETSVSVGTSGTNQEGATTLPENVRLMRPHLPNEKDLATLEEQISSTVSKAIAKGIAEGLSTGLQDALQPRKSSSDRKSA